MRWLKGSRYPSRLLIGLTLLAGCGGGAQTQPIPAQGFANNVLSGTSSPCASPPCIYASAYDGPGKSYAGRFNIFEGDANGDVPPLAHIKGVRAGFFRPTIAVDSKRNLYAANLSGNNVTVYAAGATGDVKPVRTIGGPATHIARPTGIAVDGSGRIYVSNADTQPHANSIAVFAPGANGNVAPIQWIKGSKMQLYYPTNIALDRDNNIYATNDNGGHGTVTVYAPGSNGNVPPIETIGGSRTRLLCAYAIALDSSKNIYVANDCPRDGTASINVYAAGANGNIKPAHTIAGSRTTLVRPHGLYLDANNDIYVADYDSIKVFAPGSKGNVAPIREISGERTTLKQRIVSGVVVL